MERCSECKKKCIAVGCKCDKVFCFTHRQPDNHGCTFDFKEHSRQYLQKNNPIVVNKKFETI